MAWRDLVLIPVAGLLMQAAPAAEPRATPGARAAVPVLDEFVLSGNQPGPALWKVRAGGNLLWILGEVTPLPARMRWQSRELDQALSNSRIVVLDMGMTYRGAEEFQSFIDRNAELPAGKTLKDILAPGLHQRFESVRREFAPGDRELARLRPWFAAARLMGRAYRQLGVTDLGVKEIVAQKAADRNVPVNRLHAFGDIQELERATSFGDTTPCLEGAVAALESGGGEMVTVANAWATGDIARLRSLSHRFIWESGLNAVTPACLSSQMDTPTGARDLQADRAAAWMAAAQDNLRRYPVSLAVVPMGEMFRTDGYLARLRELGFQIEEPR